MSEILRRSFLVKDFVKDLIGGSLTFASVSFTDIPDRCELQYMQIPRRVLEVYE